MPYLPNATQTSNIVSSSISAVAMPPPPNPSVSAELANREKQAEMLHDLLSRLEQRLSPVLTATGPTASGGQTIEQQQCSPVVSSLRATGYKMDAALMRLDDIIGRLEL